MLNAVLLFMGIFLYPVKIYPRINSCVYQHVRIFSCQSPIEVRAFSNAYNYDYDSGGRFSLYLIGPFAETISTMTLVILLSAFERCFDLLNLSFTLHWGNIYSHSGWC